MKSKKQFKLIQLAIAAVIVLAYGIFSNSPSKSHRQISSDAGYVQRVVDGDTLKLSDGRRVRLIGVDTPEAHVSNKLYRDARRTKRDINSIKSMGKQASNFTKSICEGKSVRLETDVQKKDKYGRLLAYAYLDDGTFINAEILSEGYGQVMTIPPNVKYSDYFLQIEQKARQEHKGLWAETDIL